MRAEHPRRGKRLRNNEARRAHYDLKVNEPIPAQEVSELGHRYRLAREEHEQYHRMLAQAGRYDCQWQRRGQGEPWEYLQVILTLRSGYQIGFTWRPKP